MIAAYCARSWFISTWRTVGRRPLTCPPLDAEAIDVAQLAAPVVYLRLHGLPEQPYLYGDGLITALSAKQIAGSDLGGSLVFLEGCYGLQMADAFREAGARAVVGSDRPTWGRRWHLGPSSRIGREWLRQMRQGLPAYAALDEAINRVDPGQAKGWSIIGKRNARLA